MTHVTAASRFSTGFMRHDARPGEITCRTERRLAGRPNGFTLLEALFAIGLLITLTGIGVPLILSSLDASRTHGAARYLSGRLNLARMEAVKRSAYVAVRVEDAQSGYRCTMYADGNRNGVLARDIGLNLDRPIGLSERLDERFPGVVFGVLPGVTAIDSPEPLDSGDPIRFGQSNLVSFSPIGTATAGTFYLHGRQRQQMAVRVLGVTGRVRVLQFDFNSHKWLSQ